MADTNVIISNQTSNMLFAPIRSTVRFAEQIIRYLWDCSLHPQDS